jgi:uncharacterized protein YjbI with pentapeptide repeats
MKPRTWKTYLLYASVLIGIVVSLLFLIRTILLGYSVAWTGFGEYSPPTSNTVRAKTLWDWMELLVIPIFLTIGAFILNRTEREIERQRTDERTARERKYAEERADRERKYAEERSMREREYAEERERREQADAMERAALERLRGTDRQQEAALQAYLDRMAGLLLSQELDKPENKAARDVSRILTLTVLRGLDSRRKGLVMLFLREANLITRIKPDDPVIDLNGADLTRADLSEMMLASADLIGVDLTNANLSKTILSFSSLAGANLKGANLSHAILTKVNLHSANLRVADLSHAIIDNTDFGDAILEGAIMPDGTIYV